MGLEKKVFLDHFYYMYIRDCKAHSRNRFRSPIRRTPLYLERLPSN